MPKYLEGMRTTVEITDTQRAKLLEIAAERGQKGFSLLVQEAIDLLLAEHISRRDRVRAAIDVLGTLTRDQAEELEASVREIRGRWR